MPTGIKRSFPLFLWLMAMCSFAQPPAPGALTRLQRSVRLLPPGSIEAEAAIRNMTQGHLRRSLSLLVPITAVIENKSDKTIIGFSLTWSFGSGNVRKSRGQNVIQPDRARDGDSRSAFEATGAEIPPRVSKAVSLVANFDKTSVAYWNDETLSQNTLDYLAELGDIRAEVQLHAVVLDDGELIGQDTLGLGDEISSWIKARHDLAQELIEEGISFRARLFDASAPAAISASDAYRRYKDSFRQELRRVFANSGEDASRRVCQKARRKTDFALSRESGR
ncbi:MAG: hypothetical protein IT170_18600 [Bryobacterales bacterium]|nr:hypothetical protein [Bryobacterales bacterium]